MFYLYLCVDRTLLVSNLGGDSSLAATALGALAEAAATVAPRGKQNSFAAHGRAGYVLAERGNQQPRTLAGAFARPVTGDDVMATSIIDMKAAIKRPGVVWRVRPPPARSAAPAGQPPRKARRHTHAPDRH
jgi:CT1975-like protein